MTNMKKRMQKDNVSHIHKKFTTVPCRVVFSMCKKSHTIKHSRYVDIVSDVSYLSATILLGLAKMKNKYYNTKNVHICIFDKQIFHLEFRFWVELEFVTTCNRKMHILIL